MTNFIIKEGYYSILLGYGYFGEFINDNNMQINPLLLQNENLDKNIENVSNVENKLIKISFSSDYHNENIIQIINNLKNYDNFLSVPEAKKYKINKRTMLYSYISTLKFNGNIHNIISKEYDLYYSFINNEGTMDLQNIFEDIYDNNNISIWEDNTIKKMYKFIKQMLLGLEFLHDNKIVHLDIKPENIMYNDINSKLPFNKRFKIIDFGFADIEPFNNSLKNLKGTKGYMPTFYYSRNEYWLPTINPNDWNYREHISLSYPGDIRYSIYKSDIFSLGRVINYLDYLLNNYYSRKFSRRTCCFKRKINPYDNYIIFSLTKSMLEELIQKRYDVKLCLKFVISNFK